MIIAQRAGTGPFHVQLICTSAGGVIAPNRNVILAGIEPSDYPKVISLPAVIVAGNQAQGRIVKLSVRIGCASCCYVMPTCDCHSEAEIVDVATGLYDSGRDATYRQRGA